MLPESICKYFRSGHCKFGEECQKSHSIETCESYPCLNRECKKRHPAICKYFSRYGRCKFQQSCSYLHTSSLATMQTDIETLMKEVDQLKAQNKVLQSILTKISQLETEVLKLRRVDGKVDNFCADGPLQEWDFIDFKCDQCDFRSKTQKGVNIHNGSNHKEDVSTVMLPLKQVVPGQIPINCIRKENGCSNIISVYHNRWTAICDSCEYFMNEKLKLSP